MRRQPFRVATRFALAVAVVAGALATPMGQPPAPAAPATDAAGSSGADTVSLTSVGSDQSPAGQNSAEPQTDAAGRYVAFTSYAALAVTASVSSVPLPGHRDGVPDVQHVYVRDRTSGHTTLLSDPLTGAGSPSISANGRLVSYTAVDSGDIVVVDRQATGQGGFDTPGNLVVRLVSGGAGDGTYQRMPVCPSTAPISGVRSTPCGPRLSGDGSTLVYATASDSQSPALQISGQTEFPNSNAPVPFTGNTIDFTPYSKDPGANILVVPAHSTVEYVAATVRFTNRGTRPFAMGAFSVTNPAVMPTAYELTANGCGGVIDVGASCTAAVRFHNSGCGARASTGGALIEGELTTTASTTAGRSVVVLSALCFAMSAQSDDSALCGKPPSGLSLVRAPAIVDSDAGAPAINAGAVEIGRPYVMWTTLSFGSGVAWGTGTEVRFNRSDPNDCGLRLVDPTAVGVADRLPAGAAKPCVNGQLLWRDGTANRPKSCTAYVLVLPQMVAPDEAQFTASYAPSADPATVLMARGAIISVRGVRTRVQARHDSTGAGLFAGATATDVSVGSNGAAIPAATQPSVSRSGRFVAFTAPVPVGQPGGQAAAGASEVWLRDTDATGNESYASGTTQLVSCLPGPGCVHAAQADSPAVSGDGAAVAFATASPAQVYLHSVPAKSTSLVSGSSADAAIGGSGASWGPAVSQDGTAVAFLSRAGNLVSPSIPDTGSNVFLRRIGPHPLPAALVPSQSATGAATGMPSLDAHGRLINFAGTTPLLSAAPAGVSSAYAVEQRVVLTASPLLASFGKVLLATTAAPIALTVTNTGAGPATISGAVTGAGFSIVSDTCTGRLLFPLSTCVVAVAFAATSVGVSSGSLIITADDDPASELVAALSAVVAIPRLLPSPNVAGSGEVTQVRGADFPPRTTIRLSWEPGLGSNDITTDARGNFTTEMVIFPRDVEGPRSMTATAAGAVLATADFLVQSKSDLVPLEHP